MNDRPIDVFTSDKELEECLKYWKDILFLNDWTINVQRVNMNDPVLEGDKSGVCSFNFVLSAATISIGSVSTMEEGDLKNLSQKVCEEQVLVHELLHCKLIYLVKDNPTYTEGYFDAFQHRTLEQISKSLIMAKYNVEFDYFNIKE